MRMHGELDLQKKADLARGRTLDGLLTSPDKYRGYLQMNMSPEIQTIQEPPQVRKWAGNRIYVDVKNEILNNPFRQKPDFKK